jgi:16S rRNA (guanine527-N7)-methyltransferase
LNNAVFLKGIESLRQKDSCIDSLFISRNEEIISTLVRYINEIEFFNSAYGLVGVQDNDELVIKHILDSLAPLGIIYNLLENTVPAGETPVRKIADAGSGAGLPGIPLAITLPMYDFTLIERMGRRAGFLWNTEAALGLSNITVEESELEKTEKGRFALVTFRAFKPLEKKLLKTLFSICAPKGIIAAYKGRREKIEEEMLPLEKQIMEAGGRWEVIPCKVPFLDEERHLLVIHTEGV